MVIRRGSKNAIRGAGGVGGTFTPKQKEKPIAGVLGAFPWVCRFNVEAGADPWDMRKTPVFGGGFRVLLDFVKRCKVGFFAPITGARVVVVKIDR